MDKVVHFEITFDDLERAKAFYGSVFDWGLQTIQEMDYTTATTTPVDQQTQMPTEPGAINGGFTRRSEHTPSPVLTIQVDSIVATLERVGAQGGSTVQPRTEIPGMGAFAYFKDSEGNVVGLWESARQG
jgi:predicted enzyme related to lactoylglutathione lyase